MLKLVAVIALLLVGVNQASAALIQIDDIAQIPTHSSLILLFIGVLCVIKMRRSVNLKSEK